MQPQYYQTYFPADAVFDFCTLHHADRPENREIAVTSANGIWRRYNSVKNASELRKLAIQNGVGATLHLGPAYSEAAHRARTPGVKAVGKQLPFDLDLTDVAFLKVPKSGQRHVPANDRFVRLVFGQVHVLRAILKEVFGFAHFLPVYSGRRGVHLWVLDERAHNLTNEARNALCQMINPPMNKHDNRLFYRRAIESHSSFSGEEVMAAVEAVRMRVVKASYKAGGIGLLDTPVRVGFFLDDLFLRTSGEPSNWRSHELECERRVRTAMSAACGVDAFHTLETAIKSGLPPTDVEAKPTSIQIIYKKLYEKYNDVLFSLIWPTIDVGPSAQMQHCVKIPFSVHGNTKRISLPVDQLLPGQVGTNLPPIVTDASLAQPGSAAHDQFLKSVAILRSAIAFARPAHPSPSIIGDIEDLAGRQAKSPRRV